MMAHAPFSVRAYGGASRLLYPAAQALLARRSSRGKEDAARLPERRGVAGLPRPEGVLVWLHGASVGEVISLLPITEHLTACGIAVLVTSGTVTSAEVAARRLPAGAIHQYLPLDLPAYVARFLDHWQPDIGVFAESELWPNLIHAAGERGTRLLIVNGRMSERSFRRWRRLPGFIGAMLGRFELVLAQTEADADRVRALGAPRVQAIGNIKYDVTAPPADAEKLSALQEAVRGRTVFVAASTHPGEESLVAEAHAAAHREVPGLLTILIPRHPERGAEAASAVAQAGLRSSRRSEGAMPDPQTDIHVADTIGELGLFYRLTHLAYLGGSLVPHGGQNPIEPAKLGAAILHGPHTHNFTAVYDGLTAAGGAILVRDGADLGATLVRLLRDSAALDRVATGAAKAVEAMSGANRRAIEAIEPFLIQARLRRQGETGA